MKKIRTIILTMLLIFSIFFSTIPVTVNAFQKEVHDFDKIWYHPTEGFNKNGQGELILAITYTNNTPRNIDYASIQYTQNPFYLSILFQDEIQIIRDTEGNIIYQEPKDGYIYLSKTVVDNHLPDNIKQFASKNLKFKTIQYQGDYWYRIHVPDFNNEYIWKKFINPIPKEKWYTWGNNDSISFETKAMFVELKERTDNGIILGFTHPTDNSGQKVCINKDYLSSFGVNNPYFEWGEKIPWKNIPFSENDTHYFINPEHFSYIGIHESATGTAQGHIEGDEIQWWVNNSGGASKYQGSSSQYQTLRERWSKITHIRTQADGNLSRRIINDTTGVEIPTSPWNLSNDYGSYWRGGDMTAYVTPNETYRLASFEQSHGWWYKLSGGYLNGTFTVGGDAHFKIRGSKGDYGYNVTRIASASSERNYMSVTHETDSSDSINSSDGIIKIYIPVSSEVNGILEVWNVTSGAIATEVNTSDEIVNNTYWYDSSNHYVQIGTNNISSGQSINWSVNCTYGATFSVNPPTFLLLGHPFEFIGLIKDSNDNPIDGYVATTKILYTNGTLALPAVEYNCSNGNIFCVISTCSLTPGEYDWEISFVDIVNGITFKEGGDLSISVGTHGHYEATAIFNVYDNSTGTASHSPSFTFYDPNTGTGINTVFLKLYVSSDTTFTEDDRLKQENFRTYTGQTLYYKVLDYFDNKIYPEDTNYMSVTIESVNQFIDIPIQMWMFSVKNMNHSIVLFELHNGSRAYRAYLFPYEPFYWYVFNGSYEINLTYYNPVTNAVVGWHNTTIDIDNLTYYWIQGYDLRDIIIEVQYTNTTVGDLEITITTDISFVNSTVNNITTDIRTDLTLTEANITAINNLIWNAINITDSVIDYINSTVWDELNNINLTVDTINNKLVIDFEILNSTMDYLNLTIWDNFTALGNDIGNLNLSFIDTVTLAENNISALQLNLWGDINATLKNRSLVMFSFYNTNDGLGLPWDILKVYINGTRMLDKTYWCYNGTEINVTIKDYYNFTMYNNTFNINASFTILNLGLTFHSWLYGNKNDRYYMLSFLKEGANRWYERGIVPYGEREYLLPSGNYTMRIYDSDRTELHNSSYTMDRSMVYVIHGTNLSTVISGQSVIQGQLLELDQELYEATMPSVIKISHNPPTVCSIYDIQGMILGNQILQICPYQMVWAITYNETITNYTTSYPLVPSNGSTNGTIVIDRDALYLSGPSGTSVNITYLSNGTVLFNDSYLPNKIVLYGQNIVITASDNITILRETRYQQAQKFYWSWDTYTNENYATINISNPLNTVLWEVTVFAEYNNQSVPQRGTVTMRDISNNREMVIGENFNAEETGIHFKLQGTMSANSYRLFSLRYIGTNATPSFEGDATDIVEENSISIVNWDNKAYNHFRCGWINPKSLTYKGPLYVILNFTDANKILPNSIRVYDRENYRELNRLGFYYGGNTITMNPDSMGEVPPGGGRSFDVYFLVEIESEGTTEFDLNSPVVSFILGDFLIVITWTIIFLISLFVLAFLCFWRNTKFSISFGTLCVFAMILLIILSFT